MNVSMLPAGANAPLTGSGPYTVVVTHKEGPEVDLTAFLLQENSHVRNDGDMVFFNQPEGGGTQWVTPVVSNGLVTHKITINPTDWPSGIERERISLTVVGTTFGSVADLKAYVVDSSRNTVAEFDLSARDEENAFNIGEIYRRKGDLKVRCEAAGFTNGLAGLCKDVGIDVAEESAPATEAVPAATPAPAINLVKQLAEAPLPRNASAHDMRKKKLAIVLVTNKLDGKIFRVILLIDSSGSMYLLFQEEATRGWRGKTQPSIVQRSLERMVPIADLFDDNHEMEVIFFADIPVMSQSVSVSNVEGYIARNIADKNAAGGSNEEQLAMQMVIDWVRDNPSEYPTIVLAWSDGGIYREKDIERLLVSSSSMPIFWMWLGLGSRANYAVLDRLDKIKGGAVDNCGFIKIDDIEKMTDEDLYGQIMAFVGKWYKEAKDKGIIAASH